MTVTPRGYTIASARSEDLAWLPAIELAAAQLLRGHAPESVLNEVTDSQAFEAAARHGHLWVARAGTTQAAHLTAASQHLDFARNKIAGVILTKADPDQV